MRKLSFILSAMLLYAVQSFAGIEEVSLYSMSEDWGATYDNEEKSLEFTDVVNWNKGRGWKFDWKYIDGSIASYTIEFDDATTTDIAIEVKYSYNNTAHTKTFDFAAGITSATINLHTDFGSDTYSLYYILIKAEDACTIVLNRAYFTTTENCDVYQAENANFAGFTANFTSADNSVVKVENKTDDDHVTFTVNAPCKAVYRLNIGYNNSNNDESNNNRACNLSINGGSDIPITLPMTGAAGNKNIGEVAYSTVLNKGANTIKIYGSWKWYNIDYLRVYMPDMYLIGNQHGTGYVWKYADGGGHMTFDSQTETFSITTRIGTNNNQEDPGTFAFATTIADNEDLGGQAYVNGHRWGPETDNLIPNTNGTTATTDLQKRSDHAYRVPMAGTYTITVKADLSSFTIQGPTVYMFGLFEGAGYSWGTNNYSMMTYDAANEVYRLRTRIADGADTSGDGAVAFATAYSDNNWAYVNANRYGPETTSTPSVDGTVNAIGLHGDKAFNNIPAHKYEVVVDMFSATKTARFYPLYTFGYEVVGTYKHGSITCSTTPGEIPHGSSVTVTAEPDAGYRFVKWTDEDDVQLSTSAEYTHTITDTTWLKAWFEPDPSCKLTIPANTFAFAKRNNNDHNDVYSAADNSFLYEENGEMYFNSSFNDGSELFYPVHLNAGTYYFYCTLNGEGEERKMRLYAQDDEGTLLYSGKKWSLADTASHNFGTGASTFETKGFTVTTGNYLIALYAKRNTRFSQIEVVGAAGGATTNTVALTLSAGSNGSVISDQINNAKILSGTEVLLLAEPTSTYRFEQWSDDNTDNPRTVTMTEARSLSASFTNASNACLNTITIQCESSSVTPSTAPKAVPTATHVDEGRIINENERKMLYYAFEITEPVTASFTLLTATSDKLQQLYLYSAQANEGTELVYNTVTYHQLGAPVAVNSPNSGYNHVYPVSSGAVSLAAGKYVIGLYSEYSWSQYDRIVISAGADNIDCSLADITIDADDEVCLPHVVRNLTVYQGGVATNDHDVRILNTITYIRPAYEAEEGGNKMNKWYPFCLPFAPKSQAEGGCQVYDVAEGRWYNINPVYRQPSDTEDNPSGIGYFYLKYFNEDSKWAYIKRDMPEAYKPYIILFVNEWSDGPDYYFENNPVVKFVGGPQTIEGTANTDPIVDEGVEKYYYYANNTLAPIHLESAYVFDPARNNFDYKEDVDISPFECYIQATESYKARHKSIAMPHKPGAQDTATGIENTMANHSSIEVFDLMGRRYSLSDTSLLPSGVWIVKQGTNISKICVR